MCVILNLLYMPLCAIGKKLIESPGYATITNRSQPSTPRGKEKEQKHTCAKQT